MGGINKLFLVIYFVVAFGVSIIGFPEGAVAILICSVLTAITVFVIRAGFEEKSIFLINLFLAALLCRMLLGSAIYMFEWQDFFGGDAGTFHIAGIRLALFWSGEIPNSIYVQKAADISNPGWGINYLVGIMYYVLGQNQLAVQLLICVLGAATAPAIYYCADKIFHNNRVSAISAYAVAFFPSMILWSCQMLKDGLIIFFLALAMACIIYLRGKFNLTVIVLLLFSLFAILALRFYVFYVVVIVILGSFVIGRGDDQKPLAKRLGVLLLIGVALFYIGAGTRADTTTRYIDLERLKQGRDEQARANSGFAEDVDISTTEGVVTILPIGLVYILFAPFPWQITNFRQLITLPDMLLWWCSFPFLVKGLWYTFKHRMRNAIGILTFTLMLTTAYAVFQGNVGTAYRQRTQIQIFLFIFVAVGVTLRLESQEHEQLANQIKKRGIRNRVQASRA